MLSTLSPGSCGDADTITIVVNPAHNASINPSGPYCETDSPCIPFPLSRMVEYGLVMELPMPQQGSL